MIVADCAIYRDPIKCSMCYICKYKASHYIAMTLEDDDGVIHFMHLRYICEIHRQTSRVEKWIGLKNLFSCECYVCPN